MGAHLNTSGKIFLGLTAANLVAAIIEKFCSPAAEPDNEFTAPARLLKKWAAKCNIYEFNLIIDEHLPNIPPQERKKLWINAGGDQKYLTLLV